MIYVLIGVSMMPKFKVWDKKTKSMWNIESWHVEDEYFDLIEPIKKMK